MEAIFSLLFKYRPILFQQGEIRFAASWPAMLAIGVAVLVAALAVLSYVRPRGRATSLDRTVMAALKVAALGVLLLCLFQPTLVLTSTVEQRNFVGVLVDDSRSMTLPGEGEDPRSQFVTERFGPEGSELLERLEERFALRFFRWQSRKDG